MMEQNFVILDYVGIQQSELIQTLEHYKEMRDISNAAPPTSPMLILLNLLASSVNATLLMRNGSTGIHHYSRYPQVLPDLPLFDSDNRTVGSFWENWKSKSDAPSEIPVFVRVQPLDYSFGLCDIPRSVSDVTWSVLLFTSPFRSITWIILAFTVLSISFAGYSDVGQSKITIMIDIVGTLSAFMSTRPLFPKTKQYPKLFLLWTFACIIISTFYSGEMTSQVIKPPQDDTITKLEQLEKQNYTMIYPNKPTLDIISGNVERDSKNLNRTKGIPSRLVSLEKLISRAVFKRYADNCFIQELAYGNKVATIGAWTLVLWAMITATSLISSNKTLPDNKRRHCYVGEEHVQAGENFFGFVPPRNEKLVENFNFLVESGIARNFIKETRFLLVSPRVQDRVKFRETRTFREEFLRRQNWTLVKLSLEGKCAKIFLLWSYCLAMSFLCFFLEMCLARCLKNCRIEELNCWF